MTQAAGESQTQNHQQRGDGARHVIICGFGLSGRSCANVLLAKGISICVIEKNTETVARCQKGGLQIIEGDASDPEVLRAAGIERATEIAVTIPQDDFTLSVVEAIRALNPTVHIIARCTFVSGGMEAHRRGANEVVVAEQIVANEFGRVMRDLLPR
jgi:voltage-gated potassium channel